MLKNKIDYLPEAVLERDKEQRRLRSHRTTQAMSDEGAAQNDLALRGVPSLGHCGVAPCRCAAVGTPTSSRLALTANPGLQIVNFILEQPRKLFSLIRYRFFLLAGIFPFLLGQAIAFRTMRGFNVSYFWLGWGGVFLVLAGVELFNEYFDDREGTDRVFSLEPVRIPRYFFPLGGLVFFLAFLIGIYFTFQVGWPILVFSLLGFLGAYFYLGPPIRWAYRGFGEIVIALSYGPFMVLGSYYLQAKRIDFWPLFISLICGLSLFSLAILNEIPDYHQDKLVGKRNIVVRLGKQKSAKIWVWSVICAFILLSLGLVLKKIPFLGLLSFLVLPCIGKSFCILQKNSENTSGLLYVINTNIFMYLLIMFSLTIGYIVG